MPSQQIRDFLDKNPDIKYSTIDHTPAYTAPEIAATCHISGKHLAKVVVVKLDGKFAMVVVPANQKINLNELQLLTGCTKAELASEFEFQDKFPDCELGAMPPFGPLYDMDVYIAESLTQQDGELVFNAGTHSELIKISYHDFEKLVHPSILHH